MNAMNPMSELRRPRVAAIRAEDEVPMRELVAAISQAHRNAVVVCEDDLVLDAIGVHLARALRRQTSLQLELYQPSSTEALLARFNGMLAELPLQAAQAVLQPHDRLRVWVLHLTQPRDLSDVHLLLRLVQGFPGAGVRLLLLLNRQVADERFLAPLGPRVHRWVVEPESVMDKPLESRTPAAAVPPRPAAAARADEHAEQPPQAAPRWSRLTGVRRSWARLGFRAGLRWPAQSTHRWLMGALGLSLCASGSLAAWWHSRPSVVVAPGPSATRPVPEILEFVDSRAALRPGARSASGAP